MGVTVSLALFGNPGHELEEGSAVKGQQLRDLADQLGERLRHAADTLDKLSAGGWTTHLGMYDVLLSRRDVTTRDQAVQQLQALGLKPDDFMILEDVEEEEEDQ
jgi:hypothetical protein